ncbi:ThiF family adenylyltransferase [Bradyrhizobium zhanjiangense]|uniref:THIF-type NAD/FAD binding fold domain-containing protein n=1 Tax=Bradyrhizobium zhanjiangense TaxID=1325107 RepID=A0ABY0DB70_9BRAD|nr:ThiF family adenylyltransferase [Bradyrhizobium zhanjiangense]RXG87359.1 hypothetical protein EAS62_36070 [Bradyrhizobium zhanjiangense]
MTEGWDTRTTALLQNLAGESVNSLAQRLAPGHLVIQVGGDALASPQGQLLVSFAANLAGRLFPVVQRVTIVMPSDHKLLFSSPRWRDATFSGHLSMLLHALPELVACSISREPPATYDWALVVGSEMGDVGHSTIFVGADGWEASFSPDRPIAATGRKNPVGAYVAACIGIAEIWKRLLLPHGDIFHKAIIRPLMEPLTFSAFTYFVSPGPNPELPAAVTLGRVTGVGVGAGGGAAMFTLASLEGARGHLNLIDPDEIEASNLNRYVMADTADVDERMNKAKLAARMFGPQVTVKPYPRSFSECDGLEPADYGFVLAAVHTREARREIQWETPGVLWDAGATQDGDFRIWRMILGQTECMHCKHPPGAEDVEYRKAAQLSKLLKLEHTVCLRKLRDNEIFTEAEAARIAGLVQDERLEFDPPRPQQRFGDWEAEQCGKLKLPELDEEVPIPFAPVMAGVLIAGEIIKEQHFPEYVLDSRYSNTLMGQFMRRSRPVRIAPKPDCKLCNDPLMHEQFRARARSGQAPAHQ